MRDAVVVGGGIIGATAAAALRRQGASDVLLLDDRRPMGGTGPSGGHLKPSWFGKMKKEQYEPALRVLDETWGLRDEEFAVYPQRGGGPATTTRVYRVDTDLVTRSTREATTAVRVEMLHNYPLVVLADGREERCRLLLLACGAWAAELVPSIRVVPKQGVSFRFRGTLGDGPVIHPWAPYKQVVCHQQAEGEVWAGDGTAVYPRNWEDGRTGRCLDRCRAVLGDLPLLRTLTGNRPYSKPAAEGDPCLLRRLGPRAWAATGAGKSGTIAAGWVTWKITTAAS